MRSITAEKRLPNYLVWEHEDLSHPSNRYRDAPQQKDYDWMKLGEHVAEGLMVAGGIAALAAGGVFLVGAAAATAVKIGMTVFLAGSLYVGEQALSDVTSGRVSDLDRYTRKAVAGSVVGFLTGASGLLMTGASLGGVLALGFGEGLVGSVVTQKLLNEDGEIDWGVAVAEAGFSAVTAGLAWKGQRSVKGVGGGGEALEGSGKTSISPEMEIKILEGQRKVKPQNEVIGGGHSPNIVNNDNPNFAVEIINTNPDGTVNVKYVKGFPDGEVSKIKNNNTLFPNTWSDESIIKGIKTVGDTPPIGFRPRDGATLHRDIINGVQIEVIKVGPDVTSGYPTGGDSTGLIAGFDPIKP